jgi:hypothetical protein
MKYDSFIFVVRHVLKEQVGNLILTEAQLLLVERFLITKGIIPGIGHELVKWLDLTIGEEDVDLFAHDKHIELLCALQIKPRIAGRISRASYLTCLFLSLHDNLETFYSLTSNENLHEFPNLVPYYKYYLTKRAGSVVRRGYLLHILSLVREVDVSGVKGISISTEGGTWCTSPISW